MSELMIAGGAIDGRGLAIDIPDDQLDMAADQLGQVDEQIELVKADLYIRKCAALGISQGDGRPGNKSPHVGRLIEIEQFCARLNTSRKNLENWAAIARKWKRGDRVCGMYIGHYKAVAGMDREAARQLLLRAQMGDPKTEWTTQQPPAPWKKWSVKRVRDERRAIEGDAKAGAESPRTWDTTPTTNAATRWGARRDNPTLDKRR